MSVDFGKLLEEQRARDEYDGPLELDVAPFDLEARFDVRRGSFRLSLEMRRDDPDRWAQEFARRVPEGAVVSSTRDGGDEVFRWRVIRTVVTAA